MKVLQINSLSGIKSTGRIVTDVAELLQSEGHECCIIYGKGIVPEKYRNISKKIGSKADVFIHTLNARLWDKSGFYSTRSTKRLCDWIVQYNPDIIHLHNIHGYYINIEVLFNFLKEYNKPVIWTLHDCWSFTGHCPHFISVGCEKWKTECTHCPQKNRYPKSLIFDRSKKNYNEKRNLFCGLNNLTIVTPSYWLKDLVSQSFLMEYPVRVINNGIDTSVFVKRDSTFKRDNHIERKTIVLGVASDWSDLKGYSDFKRLANILGEDYSIVMVGVTKKQRKDLPPEIIAIERTTSISELAEIYSSADVFVNATYEDTYPTVNLEAQACGTPVITYRTGGSVESVPEDQVVDTGDIDALASMIINKNRILKLVNRSFDKNKSYHSYLELYREVSNENS